MLTASKLRINETWEWTNYISIMLKARQNPCTSMVFTSTSGVNGCMFIFTCDHIKGVNDHESICTIDIVELQYKLFWSRYVWYCNKYPSSWLMFLVIGITCCMMIAKTAGNVGSPFLEMGVKSRVSRSPSWMKETEPITQDYTQCALTTYDTW